MYIDSFLMPVKTGRKDAYAMIAKEVSKIFLNHGATRVLECWGHDVPAGKQNSIPKALLLEADETPVLIVNFFPDKATRDKAMAALADDAALLALLDQSPTDGKRVIFGGFEMLLDEAQ